MTTYISAHPPTRGNQADVSNQRGVQEGSPNMEVLVLLLNFNMQNKCTYVFFLLFYERTSVTLLWLCADQRSRCFEGEARSLIWLFYFYGQQIERKGEGRLIYVTCVYEGQFHTWLTWYSRRLDGGGDQRRAAGGDRREEERRAGRSASAPGKQEKVIVQNSQHPQPALPARISRLLRCCVVHPPVWMRRPAVAVLAGLSACLCCLIVGAAAAAAVAAAAAAKVQQLNYRPVIGKIQPPCAAVCVSVRRQSGARRIITQHLLCNSHGECSRKGVRACVNGVCVCVCVCVCSLLCYNLITCNRFLFYRTCSVCRLCAFGPKPASIAPRLALIGS